jgi:hypothetical protein
LQGLRNLRLVVLLLRNSTAPSASGTSRADMVASTSRKAACACEARGDVLMSITGLPGNSGMPTSQSSAFLNEPGMPCGSGHNAHCRVTQYQLTQPLY